MAKAVYEWLIIQNIYRHRHTHTHITHVKGMVSATSKIRIIE